MLLRSQSFQQAMAEVPIQQLEPKFSGNPQQCEQFARNNGFKWKSNKDMLFGGYYWNDAESIILFPDI
jgi:hypothetical protein